jgi:hypothetical protein
MLHQVERRCLLDLGVLWPDCSTTRCRGAHLIKISGAWAEEREQSQCHCRLPCDLGVEVTVVKVQERDGFFNSRRNKRNQPEPGWDVGWLSYRNYRHQIKERATI